MFIFWHIFVRDLVDLDNKQQSDDGAKKYDFLKLYFIDWVEVVLKLMIIFSSSVYIL